MPLTRSGMTSTLTLSARLHPVVCPGPDTSLTADVTWPGRTSFNERRGPQLLAATGSAVRMPTVPGVAGRRP